MKSRTYKILERGLLYYPIKDKNKKFKVIDTYTLELKKEDFEKYGGEWDDLFPMKTFFGRWWIKKHSLYALFHYLEEMIYEKIIENIPKSDLKKTDWIHPVFGIVMNIKGDTTITIIVDLLKEIK